MKEIAKLGAILLLVAAIAAGVLAFTNSITAPIIEDREKEVALQAYKAILPDADEFQEWSAEQMKAIKETHSKVDSIVEAIKNGEVVGYLFTTKGGGYGGDIVVITGITEGKIAAIKILKHKETPNIGTKIEDPAYQERYAGVGAETNIQLVSSKKDAQEVEKISGSTVSSRGVVAAVNAAIDCYKDVK
ncbi:MAG: RnfABCDGE type electron transport complex subunit G [Tissierellia bacterium]|nr:RnfABCDGE type electron transport complex subunit G [Tissierellia bacterium]